MALPCRVWLGRACGELVSASGLRRKHVTTRLTHCPHWESVLCQHLSNRHFSGPAWEASLPIKRLEEGRKNAYRLKFNNYFLTVYYVPGTGLVTGQGHIPGRSQGRPCPRQGKHLLDLLITTGPLQESTFACSCVALGLKGNRSQRCGTAKLRNARWV